MESLQQESWLKNVCTKDFNGLKKMNTFIGIIILLLIICQQKKGSNLLAKIFPKNSLPRSSVKWHTEFNSTLNLLFEIKWLAASKISLDNHRGQKLWPCCVPYLFTVHSHCRLSGLQVPAVLEVQNKKPTYLTLWKTQPSPFSPNLVNFSS